MDLYAAPKAAIDDSGPADGAGASPAEIVRASRLRRFLAALVDMAFFIGVQWGVSYGFVTFVPGRYYRVGLWNDYSLRVAGVLAGSALLAQAVQGCLVAMRGQSIGKIFLGLRVVRPDGRLAGLVRGFAVRTLPMGLLWIALLLTMVFSAPQGLADCLDVILLIVALVDSVYILGASSRCLHDVVADTVVERAQARLAIADDSDGEPLSGPAEPAVSPGKERARARRGSAPDRTRTLRRTNNPA